MKKVVARHGPEISREYSGLKVAQSRVDKLAHPHTVLQVSTRMLKKVDAAPPYANLHASLLSNLVPPGVLCRGGPDM